MKSIFSVVEIFLQLLVHWKNFLTYLKDAKILHASSGKFTCMYCPFSTLAVYLGAIDLTRSKAIVINISVRTFAKHSHDDSLKLSFFLDSPEHPSISFLWSTKD